MRRKIAILFTAMCALVWMSSCNTTKFVPDGELLLDRVEIKSDVKDIKDKMDYLRQTPNTSIIGIPFLKMQLGIYNLAGKDTSKAINKMWMRMGEAPVIYNSGLTAISAQQLQRLYQNKGYFNANVDTKLFTKGKKVALKYIITAGIPYRLRDYTVNLPSDSLMAIATDSSRTLIQPNMLFDVDLLNQERERIATRIRHKGYYNFNKDYLVFRVDSTINSHQVDVSLKVKDFLKNTSDSVSKSVFRSFKVKRVTFVYHSIPSLTIDSTVQDMDTIRYKGYELVGPKNHPLSLQSLIFNSYLTPNKRYNDRDVEQTYQSLNSLPAVKYSNISFHQVNDSVVNCIVDITPSKAINFSSEVGLTYTTGTGISSGNFFAGAFGGLAKASVGHNNLLGGGEAFSLTEGVSIEKIEDFAKEWSSQATLKIPRFMFPIGSFESKRNLHAKTEFTVSYKYLIRPKEYASSSLTGGVAYTWSERFYRHTFQLLNLNYVAYPSIDDDFRSKYLKTNPPVYNPYNYEDHFIMSMGYAGMYSNQIKSRPLESYTTLRYSLESAGNSLLALSKIFKFQKDTSGMYTLWGVRYAEYVKGDINFVRNEIFDKNNKLVFKFAAGLGVPFGNTNGNTPIPWERRFYAGGANSIRGWSESTLGPGAYQRINQGVRDFNQVGDIKLESSIEYRFKMFWVIEGAAFVDAGNIWTYNDYSNQPQGGFHLNTFLSQVAVAYGLGLRFDFSFFIFRTDLGFRLHEPVGASKHPDGWVGVPSVPNDCAFHFAIGYPF